MYGSLFHITRLSREGSIRVVRAAVVALALVAATGAAPAAADSVAPSAVSTPVAGTPEAGTAAQGSAETAGSAGSGGFSVSLTDAPSEATFTESPIYMKLALADATTPLRVQLRDTLSGYEIPLTGDGVEVAGGKATVWVPELENGTYELRWSQGDQSGAIPFTVVSNAVGTNGEQTVRPSDLRVATTPVDEGGPLWILSGAGLMLGLLVAVAMRRRRVVAVLAFIVAAGIGVSGSFLAAPPDVRTGSGFPLSKCRAYPVGSVDRFTCLRDYVDASSPTITGKMDVLDALRADASIVGDSELHTCHNVAHLLGRLLVEKGESITDVVRADRGWCDYGLMHGALENGARLSTDDEWRSTLVTVCSTFTGESALQCSHGAGHGTAIRTNSAAPTSISMCELMRGVEPERLLWQCATGMFMGYSNHVTIAMRYSTDEQIRAALPEPHEVYMPSYCATLEGVVRYACWLGAFRHLGLSSQGSFSDDPRFSSLDANLQFCSELEDADRCTEGALLRAADKVSGRTDLDIVTACSKFSDKVWGACVKGLANVAVARLNESTAKNRLDEALKVCDVFAQVRPESRLLCQTNVNSIGVNLR